MNNLYKKIDGLSVEPSRIFYGTASAPFLAGSDCCDILNTVFDKGINAIDTARVYGDAEKSIGQWFKRSGKRHEVVLLSKCAHPLPDGTVRVNERDMRADLDKSLSLLGTDYIDIYLLHRDDPTVDVGEIVEILNDMRKAGKILLFGGSNWTHTRIAQANDYANAHGLMPFTVSSPNFGLADQISDPWGGDCVTVTGPDNKDARNWYKETQIPLIAYSGLAHGLFSGKIKSTDKARAAQLLDEAAMKGYFCDENFKRLELCEKLAAEKGVGVAQIAMAWIFKNSMNTYAVVSSLNGERMQKNIDSLNIPLTDEECRMLNPEY